MERGEIRYTLQYHPMLHARFLLYVHQSDDGSRKRTPPLEDGVIV